MCHAPVGKRIYRIPSKDDFSVRFWAGAQIVIRHHKETLLLRSNYPALQEPCEHKNMNFAPIAQRQSSRLLSDWPVVRIHLGAHIVALNS